MKFARLLLSCTCALAAFSAPAFAAPKQLYNKSISISFSIAIPARGSDGSTINNPRTSSRTIYVSSQGRVFVRAFRSAGRTSDTKERGPGDTGGGGSLQFSGNKLVGVLPLVSGASQLVVTFDPSFSSCSGEVIAGAESGKAIVFKGLNGVTYTATGKPQISGVGCSISEGNSLAN